MKSVPAVLTRLSRSTAKSAAVAAPMNSRCFSDDKGRIFSEEEKAAETIYIQKIEREKMEKLRLKAEKEKALAEKERAQAVKK